MPTIAELRKQFPELEKVPDYDIAKAYADGEGIPLGLALHDLGLRRQNSGLMGDLGTSVKRGVQKLPGVAAGIVDIPAALVTGSTPISDAATWLGEKTGFQPGKWAKDAEIEYSPGYRSAQAGVNEAWKNVDSKNGLLQEALSVIQNSPELARAYAMNPSYTLNQVVESLPSMLGGGAVSRGLMGLGAREVGGASVGALERAVGTKWASPVAGGVGEGVVAAGQTMDEADRSAPGYDPRRAAAASIGAGAFDMLIGVGAGRVAQRMGLETVETAMAGGRRVEGPGLPFGRRVVGGAVSEGLLQEFPQSMQEAGWQNVADGRDFTDSGNGPGLIRQGIEGAMAGGLMGASVNAFGRGPSKPVMDTRTKIDTGASTDLLAPGTQRTLDFGNTGHFTNNPDGYQGMPPSDIPETAVGENVRRELERKARVYEQVLASSAFNAEQKAQAKEALDQLAPYLVGPTQQSSFTPPGQGSFDFDAPQAPRPPATVPYESPVAIQDGSQPVIPTEWERRNGSPIRTANAQGREMDPARDLPPITLAGLGTPVPSSQGGLQFTPADAQTGVVRDMFSGEETAPNAPGKPGSLTDLFVRKLSMGDFEGAYKLGAQAAMDAGRLHEFQFAVERLQRATDKSGVPVPGEVQSALTELRGIVSDAEQVQQEMAQQRASDKLPVREKPVSDAARKGLFTKAMGGAENVKLLDRLRAEGVAVMARAKANIEKLRKSKKGGIREIADKTQILLGMLEQQFNEALSKKQFGKLIALQKQAELVDAETGQEVAGMTTELPREAPMHTPAQVERSHKVVELWRRGYISDNDARVHLNKISASKFGDVDKFLLEQTKKAAEDFTEKQRKLGRSLENIEADKEDAKDKAVVRETVILHTRRLEEAAAKGDKKDLRNELAMLMHIARYRYEDRTKILEGDIAAGMVDNMETVEAAELIVERLRTNGTISHADIILAENKAHRMDRGGGVDVNGFTESTHREVEALKARIPKDDEVRSGEKPWQVLNKGALKLSRKEGGEHQGDFEPDYEWEYSEEAGKEVRVATRSGTDKLLRSIIMDIKNAERRFGGLSDEQRAEVLHEMAEEYGDDVMDVITRYMDANLVTRYARTEFAHPDFWFSGKTRSDRTPNRVSLSREGDNRARAAAAIILTLDRKSGNPDRDARRDSLKTRLLEVYQSAALRGEGERVGFPVFLTRLLTNRPGQKLYHGTSPAGKKANTEAFLIRQALLDKNADKSLAEKAALLQRLGQEEKVQQVAAKQEAQTQSTDKIISEMEDVYSDEEDAPEIEADPIPESDDSDVAQARAEIEPEAAAAAREEGNTFISGHPYRVTGHVADRDGTIIITGLRIIDALTGAQPEEFRTLSGKSAREIMAVLKQQGATGGGFETIKREVKALSDKMLAEKKAAQKAKETAPAETQEEMGKRLNKQIEKRIEETKASIQRGKKAAQKAEEAERERYKGKTKEEIAKLKKEREEFRRREEVKKGLRAGAHSPESITGSTERDLSGEQRGALRVAEKKAQAERNEAAEPVRMSGQETAARKFLDKEGGPINLATARKVAKSLGIDPKGNLDTVLKQIEASLARRQGERSGTPQIVRGKGGVTRDRKTGTIKGSGGGIRVIKKPDDTLKSSIDPIQGRRSFLKAMVGLVVGAVLPESKAMAANFQSTLRSGDTNASLKLIVEGSSNPAFRSLAKKLIALNSANITLKVIDPGRKYEGGVPGSLNSAYGVARVDRKLNKVDVFLRGDVGLTEDTFLHEMIHAVLMARYDMFNYYLANPSLQGKNADPTLKLLKTVWDEFRSEARRQYPTDEALEKGPVGLYESVYSIDEFISHALTDSNFQGWLKARAYKGQTLWGRFKEFVKGFLGLGATEPSWLDAALRVSNEVLDAAAADAPNFSVTKALADKKVKTSQQSAFPQAAEFLPDPVADRIAPAAAQIRAVFNGVVRALAPMRDVFESLQRAGVKSVEQFMSVYDKRTSMERSWEQAAERIGQQFAKLRYTEGQLVVSKYLADATLKGWGYQPDWLTDDNGVGIPVKINQEMKDRWDAMANPDGSRSPMQDLIDKVFRFNDDMWREKNNLINQAIRDKFDEEREAAEGDQKKLAEIRQRERAEIAHYGKHLPRMIDKPYSPLKRFGKFAVVGKSDEFIAAEEEYEGTKDEELATKLREMKADPKHYEVQFVPNAYSVEQVKREMAERFKNVYDLERQLLAEQQHYELPYHVLNRLKTDIAELKLGPKETNALQRAASNLYVEMLSQTSARKNELERIGVAGHGEMMQGFISQARSDASMISTLTNNREVLQSLRAMRKEVGSDRQKTELYNEVVRRYLNTTHYDASTWQQKVMRANSIMLLITSPAYLMSNATQVYMMSLPKLASVYGWKRAFDHLWHTYGKLGVLQSIKNDAVDLNAIGNTFGKDAARAVAELQDAGKIDITVMQEIGKWAHSGIMPTNALSRWAKENEMTESAGRALSFVAALPQRIEMMNRVVTGISAYQMKKTELMNREKPADMTPEQFEKQAHEKAVAYASKVIDESQGAYDEAGAGRVFQQGNTPNIPVKLLLQFRKFQIIQLSFMVRDFVRAYSRTKPANLTQAEWDQERAVAKRALAFAVAHYGVMTGALGIPFVGMVAGAFAALGGGGDGDDREPRPSLLAATPFATAEDRVLTDLAVRKALGGGGLATLLTRGLPTLAGLDLSTSIGGGTATSILPYAKQGRDTIETLKNQAWSALGATGGTAQRLARGSEFLASGEVYKGLEQLLPSGVGNAMQGFREGVLGGKVDKSGTVLVHPEDVSGWEQALQMSGFKTTTGVERNLLQQKLVLTEQHYAEQRKEIGQNFVKAMREGDMVGAADARREWLAMAASMRAQGMKSPALTVLNSYWKREQDDQRMVVGGVVTKKSNRDLAERGI